MPERLWGPAGGVGAQCRPLLGRKWMPSNAAYCCSSTSVPAMVCKSFCGRKGGVKRYAALQWDKSYDTGAGVKGRGEDAAAERAPLPFVFTVCSRKSDTEN